MARHSTMVCQVCRLQPHCLDPAPSLAITAEIIWQEAGTILLSYGVLPVGDRKAAEPLDQQLVGPWQWGCPQGQRRDQLWQHTCFEAFLGLPGSEAYWELNVSPGGDWNLYRFSGYRRDGLAEMAAVPPLVSINRQGLGLRCTVQLDPRGFWPASAVPEIGLTMVAEDPTGALSYWALSHPEDQADFHDRRSFLVP